MDRYMKLFAVLSMSYLFIGSFLGILVAMGVGSEAFLFAHVHLNLLGFMSMMIFGVGYFILPRFNARPLQWPKLVPIHFWLANVTLVSMVIFYTLSYRLFWVSAVLQILSIVLFVVNVTGSVIGSVEEKPKVASATSETPSINGKMKIGEVIERWPSVKKILLDEGLNAFSDPSYLENVKKLGITIAMLAQRHGLDERKVIQKIATEVGGNVSEEIEPAANEKEIQIRRDDIIGDVLKAYPQTEPVFRTFYGEGCFSCPGQAFETIAQSAQMHNVDESEFLKELNRTVTQNKN